MKGGAHLIVFHMFSFLEYAIYSTQPPTLLEKLLERNFLKKTLFSKGRTYGRMVKGVK